MISVSTKKTQMNINKKKVVVGMSGGVDSSVAACLLLQQGYDVIGVTMQIWQEEAEAVMSENGGCCGLSAVEDARRVSAKLGIPYYVMNFRREFEQQVIDYFVREYQLGRTPNPCIACNRYVKWEALLNRSLSIGAEYIATGHYARIEQLANGRYTIRNSADAGKDQTYALYNLTQEQLAHTLMPDGDYTKTQIRQLAEELELPVAHKPDSQEICFIPDHDYAAYIETRTGGKSTARPGNFVDREGHILGTHQGITHYTIGQRKGLGIAAAYPLYVTDIDAASNTITLGPRAALDVAAFSGTDACWVGGEPPASTFRAEACIHYQGPRCPVEVHVQPKGRVSIVPLRPLQAVTPGQAVVFYSGDEVLGGATIAREEVTGA